MIEIKRIDSSHQEDIRIPNDPFLLWGRMIPSYQNEIWGYDTQILPEEQRSEMRFPDEPYDFEKMAPSTFFLGAYDGGRCIGLAVLEKSFFKYLYLSDLKVNAAYRKQGVGRMLVEACMDIARAENMRGVSLQAQDNNLSACLFYLKTGFRIGGLDTEVYRGTSQEGKADIMFYRDA